MYERLSSFRALEKYHTNDDVDEIGRFSPDHSDVESVEEGSSAQFDDAEEWWDTPSVMKMLDDVSCAWFRFTPIRRRVVIRESTYDNFPYGHSVRLGDHVERRSETTE